VIPRRRVAAICARRIRSCAFEKDILPRWLTGFVTLAR
jgi:hypothetical protein